MFKNVNLEINKKKYYQLVKQNELNFNWYEIKIKIDLILFLKLS